MPPFVTSRYFTATAKQVNLALAQMLFFNPSYTVFSEKLTIAKIWTLPSETLLQTQDLEKFRPSQVLST